MKEYQNPATEDPTLLGWYRQLIKTGDIRTLFRIEHWPLSGFFGRFQPPTVLYYDTTAEGDVWFGAWGTPIAHGVVAFDLWIAEPQRHTKAAVKNVVDAVAKLFETQRLILVTTTSETIAAEHLKFGFIRVGHIPEFLDGEDAYVSYMNRNTFSAVAARFSTLTTLTEAHA